MEGFLRMSGNMVSSLGEVGRYSAGASSLLNNLALAFRLTHPPPKQPNSDGVLDERAEEEEGRGGGGGRRRSAGNCESDVVKGQAPPGWRVSSSLDLVVGIRLN